MKKNKDLKMLPTQKEMNELESLFNSNLIDQLELNTKKLIIKYPKVPILFNILGICLQKKNNLSEAIVNFNHAINIQPNFFLAYNNLGNISKNLGKFEEAVNYYQKVIKINPKYAEAYNNLGVTLKELNKRGEALNMYKKAISINQNYAEAYSNLGNALAELGKFSEAVKQHEEAIKINPNVAESYCNLAKSLRELGKYEESIANYQKALNKNPKYKLAELGESEIRLARGEFELGWKKYESRFISNKDNIPRYDSTKEWDGKYLNGTLLVWSEQGIGDHIFFASMLPDLKNKAKKIILEIDKRLVNLLKRYCEKTNFLNIKIIGLEKKLTDNFDKHIAIGSLGQYLRKSKENFLKIQKKYLLPDDLKQNELENKFSKNKKYKIGISWKTLNKKEQYRNISLQEMLPILSYPNCDFINLQFGETLHDINQIKSGFNLDILTINEIDNYRDIEKLAALINSLDLVITIQNSTAHLSCALGVSTWIMLTKNARWHWPINEKKSPWYPTAKLFWQEKIGNWNSVVNSIQMDLKEIINSK